MGPFWPTGLMLDTSSEHAKRKLPVRGRPRWSAWFPTANMTQPGSSPQVVQQSGAPCGSSVTTGGAPEQHCVIYIYFFNPNRFHVARFPRSEALFGLRNGPPAPGFSVARCSAGRFYTVGVENPDGGEQNALVKINSPGRIVTRVPLIMSTAPAEWRRVTRRGLISQFSRRSEHTVCICFSP